MSAFKDCGLAFRFSVIDRLPEPPSPWASRGTLVHRALELLMLRPAAGRTLPAALTDLAQARDELASDPEFTGLELSEEEWAQFHADAELLVERYFQLEDPTTVKPIGLELMMTIELGNLRMRGIIDRLELDDDGELVVTDYKTGSPPHVAYEQKRLIGVHFYALLCERLLGKRPARIQLLYLSAPEAIIAYPSEQSVLGMERKSRALWTAIERACDRGDFRPNPGKLCEWCNFKTYCPAFGGNPEQAVELLPTRDANMPVAV